MWVLQIISLADVPTYYAIPGARLYRPIDYSETFQGPVRVRVALANSLNVPAVRVLEKVGVATFLDRLHQLGFRHLTQSPEHYGLGLTLGSGEVSLWELAQAYLTVARQGQAIPLMAQLRSPIASSSLASPSQPKTIGSATTWALITNMLSDRHARAKAFGVESVLNLPFPTAVKTGTSSDFRDTWTVGFSSDYTVATWVGNFNGDPMRQVSGVTGAAPLWQRIMLHLHEHHEPAAFSIPPGLVQRPVCALSGLKPTAACPSVVQEYFYPEDLEEYDRHLDTFYQATTHSNSLKTGPYRLNLPAEYDEWLAHQPQAAASGDLKILSPREGDYFLVSPTSKSLQPPQLLQFKLAAPAGQPVEWWLNGQKLAASGSNSVAWSLQPGNWTLQVKTKDGADQVHFGVGIAEAQTYRRGFSIAPPP
jgi:penicillin-binding protein 1C